MNEWLNQEACGSEERPDEPTIGQTRIIGQSIPLVRFASFPVNAETTGDLESMCFLAGQGVGLVKETKPAATIVRELVEGARQIIEQRLAGSTAKIA